MNSDWSAWGIGGALSIEPLSWTAILACAVSGGIIGFERKAHGKPIGIRTNTLICLGTYVFVTAGLAITAEATDPTRIVGQIITGIGFLGAGVMLTRDGAVVGATTAASIWMLAAIGVIIATQSPMLGVKLAVLSVLVLAGLNTIERGLKRLAGSARRPPEAKPAERAEPGPE